ncbi:DUF1760-domain-containing protein [Amniculicola lignicola CBS 123094]|uniref:DUF1760-domain-containing protein n=1 Tax=Amniculicola lignicola CBS 123094 TaxID=1392246 RepID=A0A6A5WHN9_9PLEO|nr:DUF1760-domain-containing protein [Amniculicola lignicola CBS 123094]
MADPATKENPILAARPPNTDFLTYLTIIEYNLTEENLPVLHQVLQDTELTQNIGWDLVHLLLPLLPASEECLEDIATKGNPREVILKVTEALRLLEFDEPGQDSDDEAAVGVGESSTTPGLPPTVLPPLYVLKFEVLTTMLSTLHQRVKAKYPSRFLSTSLQAALAAYNNAERHHEELTLAAVKLVKTLSGTKRPHLPPRTASGNLLRTVSAQVAPDPEAQADAPTADENTLSTRLFQSFITHVLEDYVLTLTSESDVPGLGWCSRLMEKFEPQRVVPNKPTFTERFAQEEDLKARLAIVGQIVALAQDLGLSNEELFKTILDPEKEKPGIPGAEDEPPNSASDIPLSKTGSLLLFTARRVQQELYDAGDKDDKIKVSIFPEHATIINNYVGIVGLQTAGLEPESFLDAVLSFGLVALEKNDVGEPIDDEEFTKYLQTVSLISANCASPSIRYHAHYLTSTILRSHPSDLVRLSFIRDTLEHCPYENLKATAVGWFKGETLEANMPGQHSHGESPHSHESEPSQSIFATPVALSTVAPFLFPDLTSSFASKVEVSETWMEFRTEFGFFLSALNFYYLLLTAKMLHENLDIVGFHKNNNIDEQYLKPLKDATVRFRKEFQNGGELSSVSDMEDVTTSLGDISLLEDVVGRVEKGVQGLGK